MSRKKILINASQIEETRVALTEDNRLVDLDIEVKSRIQKKSNIYKAKIARIEPSLNAVFVDYGSERHGFLPAKEIAHEYLKGNPNDLKSALREGQELMIQIEKEERGNKGAAVTTYITLAGCYLVLMPNNTNAGGISRRIEGDERQMLKNTLNTLEIPKDMSVIVRTAGLGRSPEELEWDLNTLLKLWDAIHKAYDSKSAPFLIYQESDVILRSIRDYLREEISEIVLDNEEVYNRVLHHVKQFRPDFVTRLHYYNDPIPLFTKYRVEPQIETAYQREVTLPSGGSIVIDHTEALTSVDINSARATKADDIEATALQTNLEASDEIARQLRLRDLGGLVVIDFIDMLEQNNKTKVEERLTAALKADRARVQVGQISRFGLLEMSRQRLRPSLAEGVEKTCPRCNGQGMIRDIQSLAVSMIRLLKDQVSKAGTSELILQLPVALAAYLANEKREDIFMLEKQYQARILLIPNSHLETPNYELKRRTSKSNGEGSHTLVANAPISELEALLEKPEAPEEPMVKAISMEAAPTKSNTSTHTNATANIKKSNGFLSKIVALFASNDPQTDVKSKKAPAPKAEEKPAQQNNRRRTERSPQGQSRNTPRNQNQPRVSQPRTEPRTEGNNKGPSENRTDNRSDNRGENRGESRGESRGEPRGDNRGRNNRQNDQRRKPREQAVASTPRPVTEQPKATDARAPELKPIESKAVEPKVLKPVVVSAAAPAKTPTAPRPSVQPTGAGSMQIQEVVQTTEFSIEKAREQLAKQNSVPMTVVQSAKASLLPKQQSISDFQIEEVKVTEKQ